MVSPVHRRWVVFLTKRPISYKGLLGAPFEKLPVYITLHSGVGPSCWLPNASGTVNAPLMRPWQNALAIVAAFLVAGALLPWELRLACAVGAVGIVLLLAVFRLRAHAATVQKKRTTDVYGAVSRIRADREERMKRPNARRR